MSKTTPSGWFCSFTPDVLNYPTQQTQYAQIKLSAVGDGALDVPRQYEDRYVIKFRSNNFITPVGTDVPGGPSPMKLLLCT